MPQTLTCPVPSDINPLSSNGFRFNITRLPELSFFCQEVDLPEIVLENEDILNPLSRANVPGHMLTYSPVEVTFMVDAKMENYIAIHNWMVGLTFPADHEQYQTFLDSYPNAPGAVDELTKNYSDAFLIVLGPNNEPVRTVKFIDIYPTSLNSLQFQSTDNDVRYLFGRATFQFGRYEFE